MHRMSWEFRAVSSFLVFLLLGVGEKLGENQKLGWFGMFWNEFWILFWRAKDGRRKEMDFIWHLKDMFLPMGTSASKLWNILPQELGFPELKLVEGERKLRATPDAGDSLHFRTACR